MGYTSRKMWKEMYSVRSWVNPDLEKMRISVVSLSNQGGWIEFWSGFCFDLQSAFLHCLVLTGLLVIVRINLQIRNFLLIHETKSPIFTGLLLRQSISSKWGLYIMLKWYCTWKTNHTLSLQSWKWKTWKRLFPIFRWILLFYFPRKVGKQVGTKDISEQNESSSTKLRR